MEPDFGVVVTELAWVVVVVGIDVVVLMGSVTEEDPEARSQPYVFRHRSAVARDEGMGLVGPTKG